MNDILHQILYRRSEALKAKIKINQLRLNKWKLIDLASKLDDLLDDRFDPDYKNPPTKWQDLVGSKLYGLTISLDNSIEIKIE